MVTCDRIEIEKHGRSLIGIDLELSELPLNLVLELLAQSVHPSSAVRAERAVITTSVELNVFCNGVIGVEKNSVVDRIV